MLRRTLATAFLAASWVTPLHLAAQDTTQTRATLCYRGRPAPACLRFVLTEIGYYARAAGSSETFTGSYLGGDGVPVTTSYSANDMGNQLTWEAGMMANRGPRAALGATLLLGFGDGGADVGLKGRYRRWLGSDGAALDVGGGVIRGTAGGHAGDVQASGITGDVALNAADYGAIVVRLDMLRAEGRTLAALYGGARLGSKPALVGTALLAAGFVALLISFRTVID